MTIDAREVRKENYLKMVSKIPKQDELVLEVLREIGEADADLICDYVYKTFGARVIKQSIRRSLTNQKHRKLVVEAGKRKTASGGIATIYKLRESQLSIPISSSRKGDSIVLRSGTRFYPIDPRPEEILIEDIAHSLSNLCRFTGHTEKFYSVAEHSLNVSYLMATNELRLKALLHDASEAYLHDIPRPLKRLPEFKRYLRIEKKLQEMIYERFGVDPGEEKIIKLADEHILYYEGKDLMDLSKWDEPKRFLHDEEFGVRFGEMLCLSPEEAKKKFLERFNELNLIMRTH